MPPPRPATAAAEDKNLPLPPSRPATAEATAAAAVLEPHVNSRHSLPATPARLLHASALDADSPVRVDHNGSLAALALAYDSPASSTHGRSRLKDSTATDTSLSPEALHVPANTPLPPETLQVAQYKAQCLADLLGRQSLAPKLAQMPGQTAAASTAGAVTSVQTPLVRCPSRLGPGSKASDLSTAPAQPAKTVVQGASTPSATLKAPRRHSKAHLQKQGQVLLQLPALPTAAAAAAVSLEAAASVSQQSKGLQAVASLSKFQSSQQATSQGRSDGVVGSSSRLDHVNHTAAAGATASLTNESAAACFRRSIRPATPCAVVVHAASSGGVAAVSPDTPAATAAPSAAAVVPDPKAAPVAGAAKQKCSGTHALTTVLPPLPAAVPSSPTAVVPAVAAELEEGNCSPPKPAVIAAAHDSSQRCRQYSRYSPYPINSPQSSPIYPMPGPEPRALSGQDWVSGGALYPSQGETRYIDLYSQSGWNNNSSARHCLRSGRHSASPTRLRTHKRNPASLHPSSSKALSSDASGYRHRHRHGCGVSPPRNTRLSQAAYTHRHVHGHSAETSASPHPAVTERADRCRPRQQDSISAALGSASSLLGTRQAYKRSHDCSKSHGRSRSHDRSRSHGGSMSPVRSRSRRRQQCNRSQISSSRARASATGSKHKHSKHKHSERRYSTYSEHTHMHSKHRGKHSKHRCSSSQSRRESSGAAARGYACRHRHRRDAGPCSEQRGDRSGFVYQRGRAVLPQLCETNTRAAGQ